MAEVEIKELPAQPVVSIRAKVRMDELADFFGKAFSKLFPYVASVGEAPVGPPIATYHSAPTPEGIDVEVCVPIGEAVGGSGEIRSSVLPAGTFASTLHAGPYEEFARTYGLLQVWMGENGYALAGPSREVYIVGMGQVDDPSGYLTEILFPVLKTP